MSELRKRNATTKPVNTKTTKVNRKANNVVEEDQIIEDFVSTHGGKWSQLSRILNRNEHSILNRYNAHIKHKDSARRGQFSLEEDLKILQFYFSECENVLEKNVKYYQLSHQLGPQLSRKPSTVYGRWVGVIQPLLTRDCRAGGCLEVDFTTILINYMVNNGLKYSQDVRWEDLVTLSQFEGERDPGDQVHFHYYFYNYYYCFYSQEQQPSISRDSMTMPFPARKRSTD